MASSSLNTCHVSRLTFHVFAVYALPHNLSKQDVIALLTCPGIANPAFLCYYCLASAQPNASLLRRSNMATIVVVDHEALIRESFAEWLTSAGHQVLVATSAEEARALLTPNTDVLLSDISMADAAAGFDLLEYTRTRRPGTAVVLCTGMPTIETAIQAVRMNAYDLLLKPTPEAAVLRSVGRAAEHSALLREKLRLEEENRRYQQGLEQLVEERTRALERRTRQLLMLQRVTQAIGSLQRSEQVYHRAVEAVHEILGYQDAAIFEVDYPHALVRLQAIAGTAANRLQPCYEQPIAEGLLGLASRERREVVVNDVSQSPDYVPCNGFSTQSQAVFPIFVEGELAFLLQVSEDEVRAFDDTDIIVLQTLADTLGVVLANVKLYAQLRESLVLRERILQNVSHELRTPLTLIRGYAEFLIETLELETQEETLRQSTKEMADTIVEQSQNLTLLVDQLIAFQRIERENLAMEPLDVENWLVGITAVWQPILLRYGLALKLHTVQPLGQVYGDWDYLTRVMQNLLDNARKFSPNGGEVIIRASSHDDVIAVAVQDNGIGASADRLPRLFERFYQADSGVNRRFGGMGLGLALVSEIIDRHNGRIWAESAGEGRGLTVTFELPMLPPDP